MRPFFFGDSQHQLFGAYHAPDDDSPSRDTRVVLAYPWIAEYNMSHWAFRKLAGMLAREGFPTLRFDYLGTGDSAGGPDEARCTDWAGNIRAAATELGGMCDARGLAIVGLGLGAALAVKAAEELPVDALVLWEPVVIGERYLVELDRLDARERLQRLYPRALPLAERTELLGFPVSAAARTDLARVDVLQMQPRMRHPLTIIAGSERTDYLALVRKFPGARLELVRDAESGAAAAGDSAMLSSAPLQAIVRTIVNLEGS
jgi:uncharacterized protein